MAATSTASIVAASGGAKNPLGLQWNAWPTADVWRATNRDERQAMLAVYQDAKAGWRKHAAYRRTMAHHFVEEVHVMFRQGFLGVVRDYEATKRVDVGRFRQWLRNLEGHHRGEDEMFFPAMWQQTPEVRPYFTHLSLDHQHLHPLERKVLESGDAEALKEFVNFLEDHLNREEMVVVPLLLSGKSGF